MEEGCLICNSNIEYLSDDTEMECMICHKRENSKSRCVKGHYVCNDCHMEGLNEIIALCLKEESSSPIKIIKKMMSRSFCHMHGPEHHVLVGSALLTAFHNAGGDIELEKSLIELINRARAVPGGSCGYWGACGAGISSGMFISIVTNSTPLTVQEFRLSNQMTSKSLETIACHGGPRCCKRDSFLSILTAIDFVKENFDIEMQKEEVVCSYFELNKQCIKEKCPFYDKKSKMRK